MVTSPLRFNIAVSLRGDVRDQTDPLHQFSQHSVRGNRRPHRNGPHQRGEEHPVGSGHPGLRLQPHEFAQGGSLCVDDSVWIGTPDAPWARTSVLSEEEDKKEGSKRERKRKSEVVEVGSLRRGKGFPDADQDGGEGGS
ncbi:hypothetical protein DL766_010283 [Monosporascus sp. MC13-8B]|nr:hypothetical protein DL763_010261 [Monosporascus cannonballus]RYP01878.1 hypothetical protein DL766_010283 [Monosporascus sp. MC13-8B]